MDHVTGICFLFLFNMARGFEKKIEIVSDSTTKSLEKFLAGAIYKDEKWKN